MVTELINDPEFWVGFGILIFFVIVFWQGVPGMIARSLDARAAVIAKELDEARRLKSEAETLLAEYKKKRSYAEQEAAAIVKEAKAEAERFSVEARAAIGVQLGRRAKQAQERIAQAEVQAIAEMRALAADAAIAAAERLIESRLDDKKAADLVKRSLEEIPSKLN